MPEEDPSLSMQTSRRSHVRYLLGGWLFLLSAVAFLDRTNVSIAGLAIARDFHLSNQCLGWIFSAFLLGYAGFQIPAGILVARFGPRRVLTLGTLWWGLATALTALLPTQTTNALVLLLVIRLALGAGESIIYPAASQVVARWFPVGERGFINGLIFAGVGAGSGLTPPLLAWLIAHHGWRAAFWFSAAVGVAVGIAWWFLARDTPAEHPHVSPSELALLHAGLPTNSSTTLLPWRALFARRDLPALIAAYFAFGYVAWIFFSWFFLYMAQVRGFDLKASARYAMLPFLSMTICCLIGGILSDRLTRTRGLFVGRSVLAAVALAGTAVFLVAGSQIASPARAGLLLAGGAGTLYLAQSSFWSVAVDLAGSSSALFASAMNMGGQIGGAVTASLTPWIAARFGWTTSFATAAVIALLGAAAWLLVHPERELNTPAAAHSVL